MYGLPKSVEELQDQAGWGDDTLLSLVTQFVENAGMTDKMVEYLQRRAEDEYDPANDLDEDLYETDEED